MFRNIWIRVFGNKGAIITTLIKTYALINEYICDKYYHVVYKRDIYDEKHVEGVLLNYNSGSIDLLSEAGVYHIRYSDIVFMAPVEARAYKLKSEFVKL